METGICGGGTGTNIRFFGYKKLVQKEEFPYNQSI